MKTIKKNIAIVILFFFIILAAFSGAIYDYFDIYSLSLNGRVSIIRRDIKEAMYVTVSNEEHNISHYWPRFQRDVEVGDSVFKIPKSYDIILIKYKTKERILCKYKE